MLLNGHGVRATLAGVKVMTRRPIKDVCPWVTKIEYVGGDDCPWLLSDGGDRYAGYDRNPLGVPGDLLYVRETTQRWRDNYAQYRATITPVIGDREHMCNGRATWWYSRDVCPSIHMPKWAARLWVRNTGVRVERVRDITDDDAEAEGIYNAGGCHEWWCDGAGFHPDQPCHCGDWSPTEVFAKLWDSIYAKRGLGWDSNCWVWVTSYEVTER